MLNELDKKILTILLEEAKPVSSHGLALRCNVSANTIRKEIALINEEAKPHGFQIEAKTSVGNQLVYLKPDMAADYLTQLQYLYKRNIGTTNSYNYAIQYLVRKLLCSSFPLSVEQLCEEMYCSRSTMLRYLEKVRDVLGSYELKLDNRRNAGLVVLGSEWNRRQCLIYQHKLYMISDDNSQFREYGFQSTFFMLDGTDYYGTIRQIFFESLNEQRDFFLPVINLPKVINYILLSASRSRNTAEYSFTEEQAAAVLNTREYAFVSGIRQKLPQRFRDSMSENDLLAVAMLILSYETYNSHLKELSVYEELYEEVQAFVQILSDKWHFAPNIFGAQFYENFICLLYTLRNRYLFHVHNDAESSGFVRHRGIQTSDLCICFVRFYKERHGVLLDESEKFSAFYILYSTLRKYKEYYYAPNILIISRYGLPYAQAMATKLQECYGKEVGMVIAREFGDAHDDDYFESDLLITDISPKYTTFCQLPTLHIDFYLGPDRCPELDGYLERLRCGIEQMYLTKECFFCTSFATKRDVYKFCADLLCDDGLERKDVIKHLEENDIYGNLERENSVVTLPVMLEPIHRARIYVLINQTPFIWNKAPGKIIVCYTRRFDSKENLVIDSIVKRFAHISTDQAEKLICCTSLNPIKILYPEC